MGYLNAISRVVCFCFLASIFLGRQALAQQSDDETAQRARDLRAFVASEIQLQAMDLLDELVFSWKEKPPLGPDARVLLVGVGVPLGLGSGLSALLENHITTLMVSNPGTQLVPVHCSECVAFTTVSLPDRTVLGRGYHFEEVIQKKSESGAVDALLFLDFEAEGPHLVLRSRLVQPVAPHAILTSHTLSSQTTGPAMLRHPQRLKSREEAREEYLSILKDKATFFVPLRIIYRQYETNLGASLGQTDATAVLGAAVSPFVWFELGFESFFTQSRRWFAGVAVGYTTLDQVHDGWSFGGRFGRLLFAERRSLLSPDFYAYVGGTVVSIEGNNALAFRRDPLAASDIVNDLLQNKPKASWGMWRLGVEARMKDRFSLGFALEASPTYSDDHPSIGTYLETPLLDFQSFGVEVGFWF